MTQYIDVPHRCHVIQGLQVDLKSMYLSHHPVYTVALFVTFHLMVSIILLNILLAVIVQTFDQARWPAAMQLNPSAMSVCLVGSKAY